VAVPAAGFEQQDARGAILGQSVCKVQPDEPAPTIT
jgi:hypothetical protein